MIEVTSRDCIFGLVGLSIMWFIDSIILRPKGIIPNGWIFAIFGAISGIMISKIYTEFRKHRVHALEDKK